jgi:hypothetical protein
MAEQRRAVYLISGACVAFTAALRLPVAVGFFRVAMPLRPVDLRQIEQWYACP